MKRSILHGREQVVTIQEHFRIGKRVGRDEQQIGQKAFPDLSQFAALEGRTWNDPVLAGSLLLVRNDREAACCELAVPAM